MSDLPLSFMIRDPIRQRVQKRIDSLLEGYRQNLAIIGPEGRGKSQILLSLYQDFAAHAQVIPIYMRGSSIDFSYFVDVWMGAMLHGLFAGQQHRPEDQLSSLIQAAEPFVPKTLQKFQQLKKNLHKEKQSTVLRELFSMTEILSQETEKKVLLMIDEFQELDCLAVSDPFALLGKEIMVQKNTLYVVTSSAPARAHEIFHHKLSLLFGNFEIIDLPPMSFREVENYLSECFPENFFKRSQVDYLIRMTDGNLLYLESLINRLADRVKTRKMSAFSVTSADNQEILRSELLESFFYELIGYGGKIHALFEKRLDLIKSSLRDQKTCVKVLIALSHGRKKLSSISNFIERRTPEIKNVLQKLVREEHIFRRGPFFSLEDPLFRFWLKEVYERRNTLYSPDEEPLRSSLMKALERELTYSQEDDSVDIGARIEALFKRFHHDVVELDGRRNQLPHFTEIAFRPAQGRSISFMAWNARLRWLCQVSPEKVNEEDVTLFLEETKRYRKKIQKKLMIITAGIDQNAKLMAHEAKIQLWDLRCLNSLLDLYDLPKLIVLQHEKEQYEPALGALAQSVHSA